MPRIIQAFDQFFDDNGDPLIDGWLKFNESGTNNTDKNTYADINESIANANPVQLDGAGRAPNIFGTGAYNVISYTNNNGIPGTQMQQFDPVGGDQEGGAYADWNALSIYSDKALVAGGNDLLYRSLSASNQGNDPQTSPTKWEQVLLRTVWNANVTYSSGNSVIASDAYLYTSKTNSNIGNDPIADTVNWEAGINPAYIDGSLMPNIYSNEPGFIQAFTTSVVPSGFLKANGAAISRTSYAALYAKIGTDYGVGDGSTTFNIPDLRGEFLRGWDDGAGNDPDAAARTDRGDGTVGDNVGTNQAGEYGSHYHLSGNSEDSTSQVRYGITTGLSSILGYANAASNFTGAANTSTDGGNESRPRNFNVMLCIKY